jgi:predicted outer membrane repeat protein
MTRSSSRALVALLLALALAFGAPSLVAQTTHFVDADATGAATGASWADAYTDLQDALDAFAPGDAVWVAEGSYFPSAALAGGDARTVTFLLPDGIALYGGFAGGETSLAQRDPAAHPTVLDGNTGAPGNPNDNAYHVLAASLVGPGTLVDGFTIARGRANAHEVGGTGFSNQTGGGLHSSSGTLELRGCTFLDNQSFGSGGAIRSSVGTLTVVDCTFKDSVADNGQTASFGGAIYQSGAFPTCTSRPKTNIRASVSIVAVASCPGDSSGRIRTRERRARPFCSCRNCSCCVRAAIRSSPIARGRACSTRSSAVRDRACV